MSLRPTDVARAENFEARIPPHLKGDALLATVVDSLSRGGTYRRESWVYLENYLRHRTTPMAAEEFERLLGKSLT